MDDPGRVRFSSTTRLCAVQIGMVPASSTAPSRCTCHRFMLVAHGLQRRLICKRGAATETAARYTAQCRRATREVFHVDNRSESPCGAL